MALHYFNSAEDLLICFLALLSLATLCSWIYTSDVKEDGERRRLPRTLPYRIPLVKNTFSFLFDGAGLMSHAL